MGVEIGGRRFEQVEDWTVEQDWWLMQRIREVGLDTIQVSSSKPEDIATAVSEAIESKLVEAGKAVELLGGVLIPEGWEPEQWTPALAAETSAFLLKQRGAQAREAVRNLSVWALVNFFASGLVSFKIFPPSLRAEPVPPVEKAKTKKPRPGEEARR